MFLEFKKTNVFWQHDDNFSKPKQLVTCIKCVGVEIMENKCIVLHNWSACCQKFSYFGNWKTVIIQIGQNVAGREGVDVLEVSSCESWFWLPPPDLPALSIGFSLHLAQKEHKFSMSDKFSSVNGYTMWRFSFVKLLQAGVYKFYKIDYW